MSGDTELCWQQNQSFCEGKHVKTFEGIERAARMKLDRPEAAVSIQDLKASPGNRFEALKGDRKGQYSIRINNQWRVCFGWPDNSRGPVDIEIVDYH